MTDFDFSYEATEPSNNYTLVIDSDIKTVWALINDFGGWGTWTKMFRLCKIIDEDGIDQVGCTRQFSPPTLDNYYLEQLTYRNEEKTTIKYNVTKYVPPIPELTMIHINVVLIPLGDNKVQLSEIVWNRFTEDAPPGFAEGVRMIQNTGACRTYHDLADYIKQQEKKASIETRTPSLSQQEIDRSRSEVNNRY